MMMEKIRKILKSKGGFTLVELLVVIVVLGILAGVGVQQFGAVQTRAQIAVDEANLRILDGATQMYAFAGAIQDIGSIWSNETIYTAGPDDDLEDYLSDFPTNPETEENWRWNATNAKWEMHSE